MHSGTKYFKQSFPFGSSTGRGGANLKLQRGRSLLMSSDKLKAGVLTRKQVRTTLDNWKKPQTLARGIKKPIYQEEIKGAAGYWSSIQGDVETSTTPGT